MADVLLQHQRHCVPHTGPLHARKSWLKYGLTMHGGPIGSILGRVAAQVAQRQPGPWRKSPWYSARTMLATLGIHPLVAVVVVAVDSMLFSGTVLTGPVGWLMSIPVGIVLGVATGLMQHHGSPRDNRGLALGKGLLVAVLTAIPTPLPAILVTGSGIAGAVTMYRQKQLEHHG